MPLKLLRYDIKWIKLRTEESMKKKREIDVKIETLAQTYKYTCCVHTHIEHWTSNSGSNKGKIMIAIKHGTVNRKIGQ